MKITARFLLPVVLVIGVIIGSVFVLAMVNIRPAPTSVVKPAQADAPPIVSPLVSTTSTVFNCAESNNMGRCFVRGGFFDFHTSETVAEFAKRSGCLVIEKIEYSNTKRFRGYTVTCQVATNL